MGDLRVLFDGDTDGSYVARLADAGGTALGVEVPFTPFLSDEDYEGLRWYLEDFLDLPDGGAIVRARCMEEEFKRWGRQLPSRDAPKGQRDKDWGFNPR